MEHEIVVHAWVDVVCPWSWIGKQHLEAGIAESGKKVAVEYHSYQLRPQAPNSPHGDYAHALAQERGKDLEEIRASLEKAARAGAKDGLQMNWDKAVEVNTFLAHQLVYAAKARGTTPEEAAENGARAVERLFRAHFTEGRNLADTDTLVELIADIGLDPQAARDELESGEHADQVREDIHNAQSLGVKGVPFYVVGGKFGISGVQPPKVFADTINRAVAEMQYAQAQEVPVETSAANQ